MNSVSSRHRDSELGSDSVCSNYRVLQQLCSEFELTGCIHAEYCVSNLLVGLISVNIDEVVIRKLKSAFKSGVSSFLMECSLPQSAVKLWIYTTDFWFIFTCVRTCVFVCAWCVHERYYHS